MMTRRELLALAGAVALSGCGAQAGGGGAMRLVGSDVQRAASAPEARSAAREAVTAFSGDLYAWAAGWGGGNSGNVVCSPYSVAVALGMTVQGARGATAREMLGVLHGADAGDLARGLNGIEAELARRPGEVPDPGGDPQRLELTSATSLWGQEGTSWHQEFLDVLAREFGAGLRTVDYRQAPEAAREAINAWVSEQTRTRIPELIPPNVIRPITRLTLVDAIWFKGPWQSPFKEAATRRAPFRRLDGSTVAADLMSGTVRGAGYVRGDGWQAVDLPYGKGELAMAVVVPDAGRFAEVERSPGTWLPPVLQELGPAPVSVTLPRWTSRTSIELTEALSRLGMPTAFTDRADFSGMTGDEPLKIAAVVHEGFVSVDEAGTEAAAATAVVVELTSAVLPRYSVVADRPFVYVVHDRPTGTPLFIGRVLDPTA
jgi:serpin B